MNKKNICILLVTASLSIPGLAVAKDSCTKIATIKSNSLEVIYSSGCMANLCERHKDFLNLSPQEKVEKLRALYGDPEKIEKFKNFHETKSVTFDNFLGGNWIKDGHLISDCSEGNGPGLLTITKKEGTEAPAEKRK